MKHIIFILCLIGLSISAALPESSTDPAKGCGIVTNEAVTFSYSLVGDGNCRDLHANDAPIKSYYIAEGCSCVFYAHDQCSKKPAEQWMGWVFGSATGDFTKQVTTHYLCGLADNPFPPKE
ncbi:hypothetical protein BU23DRAFT_566085 [Bimuria novae-zelandiae CBS 107.79]|uniref:Uncharacterized protein n=1 Tax=Bimuria novae-zelandiae CBS 107.79 TaxID=1447943 RepID=A0A6A5VII1_9PLEO|nr:hypothetical protein BU23DRAFT_566085 [Bimuria novae-zelandiae CBS 107.79]